MNTDKDFMIIKQQSDVELETMATIYSVKIHYGPCNTFYCSTHKPGRLTGLRDRLQTMGYRVQLIPEKFENYCMIEMCGHEIFRCKLGNLMFNTSCELDPVCQRAVAAILDASRKFIRARCHLWVNTIIKRRISCIGSKHLIDHWAQKYDMDSFAPVSECVNCCGICSSQNK
ncbi:uncharacterized protein LOC128671086 isoform X2 [Plodia interpunctella]|uniref:uncharacterized protein LOC128671086 isoform X2 n=1 Tax=Plodia interpunctella TaxID=58824 RepID=UPI002368933F|nr:uncharacterized protein LOC128671086 isoform X2 [Plodia interpunctella]